VSGRAGTAGRASTARFSCRARPGTIKRAVLRAGPLGTTHLAIYSLGFDCGQGPNFLYFSPDKGIKSRLDLKKI
jgi:hypothetical protein